MANTSTTIRGGSEQEPVNYENLLNILENHLEAEVTDKPFLIKDGIKVVL